MLLGSHLLHLYRNDARYYDPASGLRAKSIVVHYLESSFDEGFLQLPEVKKIRELLLKSVHGIELIGTTNEIVSKNLYELCGMTGFPKFLKLLEILQVISASKKLV